MIARDATDSVEIHADFDVSPGILQALGCYFLMFSRVPALARFAARAFCCAKVRLARTACPILVFRTRL
jgi:hypothetical protein